MPSITWGNIRELGIKPVFCDGQIPEKSIAYVPGMRVDTHDAYLIQGRVDHVRRFIEAGGDPDKAIAHFLTHDDYLLEPLWGPALIRRIEGFKALGCHKVVAPDFSTWGVWPVLVHLQNYYKSNRVCHDFLDHGFSIVCHPNFTHPKLEEFSASLWEGPCPTVLVDAIHSQSGARDAFFSAFLSCIDRFGRQRPDASLAIWGRYRRVMAHYASLHNRTFFVPSFVAMRAEYISAVQAAVKRRKQSTSAKESS